jgi:hypothetical protein
VQKGKNETDPILREIDARQSLPNWGVGVNDLELTTVLRPADSVLAIARTHDRRRPRPGNRQVGIVVSDCHVPVRSVKLIDPVDDISDAGQRLKPVQKPARDVDLRAHLIVEQEGHDLTEGCRSGPGVDHHVEHRPICAPDELRLTSPRATMQPAAYALVGA